MSDLRRAAAIAASGLIITAVAGVVFAGCGSHASTTTTLSTTATTTTVPMQSNTYSFASLKVRAAFPGTPTRLYRSPQLEAELPRGAAVVTWSVGDIGVYANGSFELAIARFPAGSTTRSIDLFLERYAAKPNTTMYGSPAVQRLNLVPFSGRPSWSGMTAFSVGKVLVLGVGLDTVRAAVQRFLSSLQLVNPS